MTSVNFFLLLQISASHTRPYCPRFKLPPCADHWLKSTISDDNKSCQSRAACASSEQQLSKSFSLHRLPSSFLVTCAMWPSLSHSVRISRPSLCYGRRPPRYQGRILNITPRLIIMTAPGLYSNV
ncbi:hypothetical protein F5888DRAFT_1195125 [Russula emetica]|nr:hypothetical protein F5888DRAFT_1195125 [Russula emetica]